MGNDITEQIAKDYCRELKVIKEEIKLLNRIIIDKDIVIEQLEEKHMLAIVALGNQIKQNTKLIACLKRAYAIVLDNCPPALSMYDECTDENCLYCQKRFIAHG